MSAPALAGFDPIIAADCRAVVLGSFPSAASLDAGHYYAHPRNQFWTILGEWLEQPLTQMPFEARYQTLRKARLGLWDVIARCDRSGSLDGDIRNAQTSQLEQLQQLAPGVCALLLNGKKAQSIAHRFEWPGIELVDLPSTSPAFAAMRLEQKAARWEQALSRFVSPVRTQDRK